MNRFFPRTDFINITKCIQEELSETDIDANEVFIKTPSGLMLQAASCNSFEHYNTLKRLVAYALNSSIFYILLAYLGSVSDPILTKHCGFLNKLDTMKCLYNGR